MELFRAIGSSLMAFIFLGLTILFLAFVVFRHDLRDFRNPHKFLSVNENWAFAENKNLNVLKENQPLTVKLLLGSLIFTAILFILFACRYTNLWLAPCLGSATILLLATASWVPAGSVLIYFSHRRRFPVLTFVAIYLVAISGCNDNHTIAHIKPLPEQTVSKNNPSRIEDHLAKWIEKLALAYPPKLKEDGSPKHIPIYLVAAEGGGIRAAYWTASVLGKLQERDKDFAFHTYVISGVSGGSLGGAVFDALLATDLKNDECFKSSKEEPGYTECAQRILSEDFLAPAFASMFYPDVVQRFLPFSIDYFDRGRTLEMAWEKSWKKHIQANESMFKNSFDALWANDKHSEIPSLILNSTRVETGHRVILSNLPISPDEFVDVTNLRDKWGGNNIHKQPIDMALSTAVHGSARFTYVSPAGKIDRNFHIVDGGYFENSGNTSLIEVLRIINKYQADDLAGPVNIKPIVIHISNDPVTEEIYTEKCIQYKFNGLHSRNKNGLNFGSETLPPIITLINTRDARGVYASGAIAREVTDRSKDEGLFVHFGLEEPDEDKQKLLPLGWSLSTSAEKIMKAKLDKAESLMKSVKSGQCGV